MSSKSQCAPREKQKNRGRRIAIVALVLCTAAVAAYFGLRQPADRPMTLEEMERTGRVVLAYGGDDLTEMVDLTATRTFMVTVVADGQEHEVRVASTDTVDEILKKAKVTLGPDDEMSHFPGRTVRSGERIVIERWTTDTATVEVPVPFEVVEVKTSLLAQGQVKIANEGAEGVAEHIYERVLRDGEVMEQTLIDETLVQKPVNQRKLVGTAYAPVSPYDFQWEFDANGDPVGYAALLENQHATGYSARAGAGTACGYMPAAVGHVAVNPNEIPYGSKLYIRSTDGKFVYGYAIAADTGTGLMQGLVDVDLFYATYAESCYNGRREVDIYVLEYPQSK